MESGSLNSRAAGSGVVKGMVKDLKTKYNKEKMWRYSDCKEGDNMTEKKIREVIDKFAEEAKRIYGIKLEGLILYGSCARGDFQNDSDIDIITCKTASDAKRLYSELKKATDGNKFLIFTEGMTSKNISTWVLNKLEEKTGWKRSSCKRIHTL